MSFKFPLATTSWGKEELDAMQRVIASGQFTMGETYGLLNKALPSTLEANSA